MPRHTKTIKVTGGALHYLSPRLPRVKENHVAPTKLLVWLHGLRKAFREYHDPLDQNVQQLVAAHTDGGNTIPLDHPNRQAFEADLRPFFDEELEIEVPTVPLTDLEECDAIAMGEETFTLLLDAGVVVGGGD